MPGSGHRGAGSRGNVREGGRRLVRAALPPRDHVHDAPDQHLHRSFLCSLSIPGEFSLSIPGACSAKDAKNKNGNRVVRGAAASRRESKVEMAIGRTWLDCPERRAAASPPPPPVGGAPSAIPAPPFAPGRSVRSADRISSPVGSSDGLRLRRGAACGAAAPPSPSPASAVLCLASLLIQYRIRSPAFAFDAPKIALCSSDNVRLNSSMSVLVTTCLPWTCRESPHTRLKKSTVA
jgi:hypothetical protein